MKFLYSFDFVKMHQDKKFVLSVPAGIHWRAISQPGYQYAIYFYHARGGKGASYIATPRHYADNVEFKLPQGTYEMDWVDPATDKLVHSEMITHHEGPRKFTTPIYTVAVALRIKRM